ncbi:CBS domain-containing protein [Candidatus Thioglobus sp.]|nr:CBS domain-containing protein [Candidatus Thioglobus sp.]
MYIQNKKMIVSEVMLDTNSFPIVTKTTILKAALEKMDDFRLGIACITDNEDQLLGIITDGDVRRKLLSVQKPLSAFFIDDAINQAIKNPITISSDVTLIDAVDLMEKKQVWDLPVVDNDKLIGLLHLHPAVKALLES